MDEANNDFRLVYIPAKDYIDPDSTPRPVYVDYEDYPRVVSSAISPNYAPTGTQNDSVPIGYIPQVAHTYGYLDLSYGALNDQNLAIGESTCSAKTVGIPVSAGGKALFWVGELSHVAMERCATARCAVQLMGELAEKYGFYADGEREGAGETLTVADTMEAWVFHVLAGADDEGGSAIWVAKRVPADQMTVVSNMFTIREVDLDDKENYYGRTDMEEVAKKNGWWDGVAPFDFTAAFSIGEYSHEYYSGRRMWRALSLAAPSLALDPTIGSPLNSSGLGENQTFYPWSVIPDAPLRVQDLQKTHRDHYEGTPFDITKGLAAGPFSSPNRWGGAANELSIHGGAWERPISVYRVNYNHITQLRSWLPRVIGGCLWFGPHVPHGTVYVPVYVGAQIVPSAYSTGNMGTYDRKIAWWRHAFVSNWAQLKWSYIIQDVNDAQSMLEKSFFDQQPKVEANATALFAAGKIQEARDVLAEQSRAAENLTALTWLQLADDLVTKYKDGFVDTKPGDISKVGHPVGYPTWWLRAVGFPSFPAASPTTCHTRDKVVEEEERGCKSEVVELREKVLLLERRLRELEWSMNPMNA
jgi:dipeptidase